MTAEDLGQPSEILEEWLKTQPHNWVEGMWDVDLNTSDGVVSCRCQGAILRDHALERMGREPGPLADTGNVSTFLVEVYHLDREVVREAIRANDGLDAEDTDRLGDIVTDEEFLTVLRSLAPKYIGRAIAVYKRVGR